MTVKSRIGYLYAKGARAYENNPEAADKIRDINKHVYAKDDELINTIYDWGVRVSFSYFDEIFKALGVEFEKRYLESEATGIGVATVRQHIGDVFSESQGAVIFAGEEHGLHTRVFINSEGLPTYEAKDLGLAELKNQDYLDVRRSIIITANEQTEYFKVMLAALKQFQPELASITTHIAHGFLSLTTGKMSSRTGDVHSAQTLLDDVAKSVEEAYPDSAVSKEVYVAAIKYAFLKQRIGGNITFDVQESVALEGHSGPYLQYAHARARSILRKAQGASGERRVASGELQAGERSLTRKIGEYAEVVDQAVNELMPHHVATYLYELAQNFNRFYENNRVVGDERQELRLNLVSSYADTLKNGLELLGIAAPDKM
jgi:arginyl-tRNA synthetase